MKRLTTPQEQGYVTSDVDHVIHKMGQFEDMIVTLETQIDKLSLSIDEYRQNGDIKNYRVRELAASKLMYNNVLNTLKQFHLYSEE